MIVLPNGLSAKKTLDLSLEEMDWLARGEHMCRKLNLTIACPRCLMAGNRTGAVLRGANDEKDDVLSVTCDCRRMVFRQRAG